MKKNENFSERLKFLRKCSKLTQKQVSEKLGIMETLYQKYESGKSLPGFEATISIAKCFDVSLDYLMTGENVSDINNI